jgi:cytoskeletal protein CcmA (bactofilin family)
MPHPRSARWTSLLGPCLALLLSSPVAAQVTGKAVVKRGIIAENLYVAGRTVDVQADVKGDLLAAGEQVVIGGLVKEDVTAAGRHVRLHADVGDDVRAVGETVDLDGQIGGDVVAAAGRVTLGRASRVRGKTWLAGGTVEVQGTVDKWLRAVGSTLRIAGEVRGNVSLTGQRIEILPSARIDGDLTYRSPQAAQIDPGAQIRGRVTRLPIAFVDRISGVLQGIFWILWLALSLGFLVAGMVLVLLFPNASLAAARTIGRAPGKSFLLGLVLLAAVPIAVVLLLFTLISVPLALALLALYFVLLLIGFLATAVFLGDLGIGRSRDEPSAGGNVVRLAVGLILLYLVWLIPYAGPPSLVLAIIFGFGAWAISGYRAYRGPARYRPSRGHAA